jgi:hypothetical protein
MTHDIVANYNALVDALETPEQRKLASHLCRDITGLLDLWAEVERLKAQPVLQFIISEPGPGPEAGRFIEVEDGAGHSIRAGSWAQRQDGNWALTVPVPTGEPARDNATEVEALVAEIARLKAHPTAAQERAAIVAWIKLGISRIPNGRASCFADVVLPQLVETLERGEHWPTAGGTT